MASLLQKGRVTIQVSGDSSIHRDAERAVLFIIVASEGSSQEAVSKDVTSTSSKLRASLLELAEKDSSGKPTPNAPITHWTMTSLSTGSYLPNPNSVSSHPPATPFSSTALEQPHAAAARFTASTRFEIKFRSFTHLGPFTTALSTTPHVSIAKLEWRLTDATEATLGTQSRQLALQDALGKAKDFADALAKEALVVEEVSGGYTNSVVGSAMGVPGLLGSVRARKAGVGGGGFGLMAVESFQADGADEEAGDELSFEPQSVTLSTNVQVRCYAQ